ncbi:MAG: hypothetical protein A2X97_02260 [Bdellovibrionales bacterium GWA1_52_35]|nr:MAG: hypothetical protein A2X97_02260 [Bdellovibrionales bacterium GWA1_52_35]HCM39235.1 hypothetical protein [Bdellovibrionales bacterium]
MTDNNQCSPGFCGIKFTFWLGIVFSVLGSAAVAFVCSITLAPVFKLGAYSAKILMAGSYVPIVFVCILINVNVIALQAIRKGLQKEVYFWLIMTLKKNGFRLGKRPNEYLKLKFRIH